MRDQRKETDGKGASKQIEIKPQGRQRPNQKVGGKYVCIYNQASSPQRKSSLYKPKLKNGLLDSYRVCL